MRPLVNLFSPTPTEQAEREPRAYCCSAWFIFSDQVGCRAATAS